MRKWNLFKSIGNTNKKPVAVQCLWDWDIDYLALDIDLVFKSIIGYTKTRITSLRYVDFESQEDLIEEANNVGHSFAEEHQIEFYFPSPDEYTRNCPEWWEVKSAIKCEECRTPIKRTNSNLLSKSLCTPCRLKSSHG